jgi:hypothetical protein
VTAYGNVNLNDSQQQQLYDLALKHGIGLNNKYDQIDENGQISEAHHKLRNTLIAAAIAGAAATGLGAAGIGPLSGMFGAGTSAVTGAGTAATTGAGAGAGAASGVSLADLAAMTGTGAGVGTGAGAGAGITLADLGAITGTEAGTGGGISLADLAGITGTGGGASSTTAGGASLTSKLLASLKNPDNLAKLAKIAQQGATDAQGNRIIQGNFAGQYDRNMLAAEAQQERLPKPMPSRSLPRRAIFLMDIVGINLLTLLSTARLRALPDFGWGYTAPSEAQKAGATTLQSQLLGSLKPGGTYTPMPFSDYGTPGTGEQIQSRIGEGLGIAGGYS